MTPPRDDTPLCIWLCLICLVAGAVIGFSIGVMR